MKTQFQIKITSLLIAISLIFFSATSFAQKNQIADTLKVYGSCAMCKNRIETALKIPGIIQSQWNVNTKILSVTYNPDEITLIQIHEKMASIGHDTELKTAPEEVYKALPDCCLYRDGDHKDDEEEFDFAKNAIGLVMAEDTKGNLVPLEGASVMWLGSKSGVTANEHGMFSTAKIAKTNRLMVSFTGFQTDTLTITEDRLVQIVLVPMGQLKTIEIKGKPRTTYIDALGPFRTLLISSKDLLKDACCTLSESFETNPSVDAVYSDAVTGSRQIQLLGLAGKYTQIMIENIPTLKGLASPLGLNSIAGPWIENIQLIKGPGSVVYGPEGISGLVNVELKKPENTELLYINGYVNDMGKTDFNLNWSHKLNDKWSTGILLHNDFLHNKVDFNKDGFRDLPTGNLFSGINRWTFNNKKGLLVQLMGKVLIEDRIGGEVAFDTKDKLTTNHYGLGFNINRYEGFAKLTYTVPDKKYQTFDLQLSAFNHDQKSFFGINKYDAKQNNIYANFIYQSILFNPNHKFRAGLSVNANDYDEVYKTVTYKRNEVVTGGFLEYNYSIEDKFSAVAGIRYDYNNIYGWFATPRFNIRYEPVKGTVIRLSAGRAQQTANIFAENMATMVSSRNLIITQSNPNGAYGLNPEISWNKGISIDQKFKLFSREAVFSIDYFRNDFIDQVVVDLEDIRNVHFYNLKGKSYSNSFQAELNFLPIKGLEARVAYRWFEVNSDYDGKMLSKPFSALHRAFTNLSYGVDGWRFDYTFNIIGSKRIPSTFGNPMHYQLPEQSPSYVTMNAQITKTLGKYKNWDFYLGVENLTNYFQNEVIIAPSDPFGPFFDASMNWGPLSGRMIYGGFRFKLN